MKSKKKFEFVNDIYFVIIIYYVHFQPHPEYYSDYTLKPASFSNISVYWMQFSSSSPPLQSFSPSQTYLLKMQPSTHSNCSPPPLQLLGDTLCVRSSAAEYWWMSKNSVHISFKSISLFIHVEGEGLVSFFFAKSREKVKLVLGKLQFMTQNV